MKQRIAQLKKKILPFLKANGITYAAVFGSYARGKAKKKSDIDLLVKFGESKTLLDLVHIENELTKLLRRKTDLVAEDEISPYIKPYIVKDLQVIYEKR